MGAENNSDFGGRGGGGENITPSEYGGRGVGGKWGPGHLEFPPSHLKVWRGAEINSEYGEREGGGSRVFNTRGSC